MAGAVLRTHNPLVAGSSPACPTFSTHTSERGFTHFSNAAKTSFYAILTQSTAIDQLNLVLTYLLRSSFSKKSNQTWNFRREQRELWEQLINTIYEK
jgi:hypothetical protein